MRIFQRLRFETIFSAIGAQNAHAHTQANWARMRTAHIGYLRIHKCINNNICAHFLLDFHFSLPLFLCSLRWFECKLVNEIVFIIIYLLALCSAGTGR